MRVQRVLLIGVCGLLAATAVIAGSKPITVSPGDTSKLALIGDSCPTFSWGQVDGAQGYELVVYRLGEDGKEAQPVLRQSLSGGVGSWTPALGRCLARSGRYAWSVRAIGAEDLSDWSPPSLFQVAAGTSAAEFEAALQVVRSYLDAGDEASSVSGTGEFRAEPEATSRATRSSPAPRAVGTTQMTVDGGIEATSFTGDGSTLTSLDPANLSAGTAGINISLNAATATALAADPADCSANRWATGIAANGSLTCASISGGAGISDGTIIGADLDGNTITAAEVATNTLTGSEIDEGTLGTVPTATSAATATALAANGANCPPGMVALGVNAAGAAECTTDTDTLGGLSCSNGQVAKWNTSSWTCGADSGAVGQVAGDGYFSGDLRIDGDLGIGTDPLPGTERNIYMYDSGIYSDPQLYISGHNSGVIRLQRRRTDSSDFYLRAGCGSVNCANDFSITHSTAGTCIAVRDGCDVDIPKLEVDTFKSNPTDSPGTCSGTTEGRFYYDKSLNEPCFCNGSAWRQFDGGGTC